MCCPTMQYGPAASVPRRKFVDIQIRLRNVRTVASGSSVALIVLALQIERY